MQRGQSTGMLKNQVGDGDGGEKGLSNPLKELSFGKKTLQDSKSQANLVLKPKAVFNMTTTTALNENIEPGVNSSFVDLSAKAVAAMQRGLGSAGTSSSQNRRLMTTTIGTEDDEYHQAS